MRHGSMILVWTLFAMAALTWPACGSTTPQVRSDYAAEVVRCVAAERAIVDRPGTTEEQDRLDLQAERLRCDAALASVGGAP